MTDALIAEVARRIDGPFWLYDAEVIRGQIRKLAEFDSIRYAQKANSNIHILKLMRDRGVYVDAVSLGEVERALAAGFRPGNEPAEIVYTADIITRETLSRVVDLGIPVNCGSPDMVEQIGRAHRGHPVWLRVNPGFGHGHSAKTNTGGKSSKHGIWHEYMQESIALVDQYDLDLVGFHMHIGSGVDYNHLENVCEAMVREIKLADRSIRAISAGGGLSTPYCANDREVDTVRYFNAWRRAQVEIERHLKRSVHLEIEPGRFLTAQSGVLVAQVRAVKRVANQHFVLINAGFNDLARPAMYGSYHHIDFIHADGSPLSSNVASIAVAGHLCESGDVFTQAEGGLVEFRDLPLPRPDDLALIRGVGAYGASMSSNYNTHPLIPEVLVDGTEIKLIRKRQTVAALIELERDVCAIN